MKIHEQYLKLIGKGFQFDTEKDLSLAINEKKFLESLTFEQCVELVEGLDEYAKIK